MKTFREWLKEDKNIIKDNINESEIKYLDNVYETDGKKYLES